MYSQRSHAEAALQQSGVRWSGSVCRAEMLCHALFEQLNAAESRS